MSLEVSLWKLEDDLTSLIQMREEASTPGEIAVLDEQLRIYFTAEIRKVDGIRGFWRHCELMAAGAAEEVRVQSERAHAWKLRLERLKAMCKGVLEMMDWPEGKPKKLEGRTGSISLKANGGKQAVVITDESLVPEEYQIYTVKMPGHAWAEMWRSMGSEWMKTKLGPVVREPVLALIGEGLRRKCEACDGDGQAHYLDGCVIGETCSGCGGSGLAGVPGATLQERGVHVECR